MATQYDPIAKDESLNTTENPSRNIADVLAEGLSDVVTALGGRSLEDLNDVAIVTPSNGQTLKYNSTTQKWENANDAGGHTIIDSDGTSMTQRAGLAFPDAHTSDNSTDDQTEVEIMEATTEQAFDALNPSGNEYDGVYLFKSGNALPLTADMVGYGNGTVKGALDELRTDSGWVQLSAVDGNKMMYRKIGKLVYVAKHTVGTIAANTAVRVGTLPLGYRPLVAFFSGAPTQYIQINTDGKIYVRTATADYMEAWYVSFIADA